MSTSSHRAATLAAIPGDIRRCTTPTRDPRERPTDYERLLRLSSRYSHHRQFGRERAAEACKRMAERIRASMLLNSSASAPATYIIERVTERMAECEYCDGEGRVPNWHGTGDAAGGWADTCDECQGTGKGGR